MKARKRVAKLEAVESAAVVDDLPPEVLETPEEIAEVKRKARIDRKIRTIKRNAWKVACDELARCEKEFYRLLEVEKELKKPSKELRYCTTTVPWAMWERAAKIRSKTLQREIEQFPMRKWLLYVANHYCISLEEAYLKIVRVMKAKEV